MKTIGFVQVNFPQGPKELNAHFLPYSAGVVLAYALQHNPDWQVTDIVWRRDPIESTAQALCHNDLVAFSVYVWNREYSYALAKRIKQLNPLCMIVVGGPEPAIVDPDIFHKHPYLDAIVKMEGEKIFSDLLAHYGQDLTQVAGLVLNSAGQAVDTGNAERISDLAQLPSPYLTGLFDQLIQDHPDVIWNGTLETNRGCPYQCTFCDWGSLTYSKVKQFDLERVFAELDWMGQNCGFVTITDANFGMFIERDNAVIDKLIEVQRHWGKITNFSITWAKNQKNAVIDIVKKLVRESPTSSQGLTVSVQSMDSNVLDIIKRKNLNQHKISEIFSLCDQNNIPIHTELILGLPGETAQSWRENFWTLFKAGNHTGISILHAQLLENAEMNLSQRKFYQLDAVPIYDYMSGSYSNGEVEESIEVVVGTRDISRTAMLDIMTWNSFINAFHINGLTTYIARYLHSTGVEYSEFYDRLYKFIQQDPWWHEHLAQTRQCYQDWIANGRVKHTRIGNIEMLGWHLHNRTTLMLHQENRIDCVYDLATEFINNHYKFEQLEQLIQFQKATVIKHTDLGHLPKQINLDWDFWGHLVHGTDLDQPVRYEFDTAEDKHMSATMFLENFYFGRKRNFGKTKIARLPVSQSNSNYGLSMPEFL